MLVVVLPWTGEGFLRVRSISRPRCGRPASIGTTVEDEALHRPVSTIESGAGCRRRYRNRRRLRANARTRHDRTFSDLDGPSLTATEGDRYSSNGAPDRRQMKDAVTGLRVARLNDAACMCGCILGVRIPALAARCLSRRVAACRSILVPRVLRRIGPSNRPSTARSTALATAGARDDLAALAAYPEDTVVVLLAEVADVRTAGFEDPQPQQAEHGDQREVVRVAGLSCGGDQCFELEVLSPRVGDSGGTTGLRT